MSVDQSNRLFAPHALLPQGWARDVSLAWDDAGTLTFVGAGTEPDGAPPAAGVLVPGMPNLHSHAFQRAFAGLSEYRSATGGDSFWTWRDLMYRFALAISPEQLEAIATQLYIEMLQAGYTAVCEFHYLHHDPAGRPYADPAEMSMRLVAAARRAGIGLTLLPVLYQDAGFGGRPPRDDQRRFINGTDALLDIAARVRARGVTVGVAPHSLRAVGPRALREIVSGLHAIDACAPVHLHIAEQQQEVDDCVRALGARPVEWLLANAPVDARWCLVHATHLNAAELQGLAASGAVAGLCPTTEANLGDGIFRAADFFAAGGAWGIGSDSHASVSAGEELRSLEYSQRLARRQRNVLAGAAQPQLADHLWLSAVAGGARASGRAIRGFETGQQADFIALADRTLEGLAPAQTLASHVFASHGRNAVRDVWVAGRQCLRDGVHAAQDSAREAFVAARGQLMSEV
ncbi:MAG TPA: formimidoylglutamate deiminase [Burkholderiaceae bacterium]|jgi:formimidoylglutamate deiminase